MIIKCKRLIELARTGLERKKRPPKFWTFHVVVSRRTTKNWKSAWSVELITLARWIVRFMTDILVTIVIAKAPPYYLLLCVLTELTTRRDQEWSLNSNHLQMYWIEGKSLSVPLGLWMLIQPSFKLRSPTL